MPDIKRQVKLVTKQHIISEPSEVEGFPLRSWSIEIYLVNENGKDVPATLFEKATYKLHDSFDKRAIQTIKKPPFRIEEKGWGEFEMQVILTAVHRGGDHTFQHDLNFQSEEYDSKHVVSFRNPKPELLSVLRESGPVAEENGFKGKGNDSSRKKMKKDKTVDMDKLANGLQALNEDDLLHVVQMIHDYKSNETYTKNDIENGEFHVDLYTLPDQLIKMLWEFVGARTEL